MLYTSRSFWQQRFLRLKDFPVIVSCGKKLKRPEECYNIRVNLIVLHQDLWRKHPNLLLFSTFWSLNHTTERSSRPTRTLRMIFSNIYPLPLKTFLLTFLDQSMSWTELGCGREGLTESNWSRLVSSLLVLNYLLFAGLLGCRLSSLWLVTHQGPNLTLVCCMYSDLSNNIIKEKNTRYLCIGQFSYAWSFSGWYVSMKHSGLWWLWLCVSVTQLCVCVTQPFVRNQKPQILISPLIYSYSAFGKIIMNVPFTCCVWFFNFQQQVSTSILGCQ